jgi:glycosyltransferase involved in cell wall biosynthesis
MACGTLVIGVAEGGVRETIRHGETGLLTDRDPKQFADALLKLLADPSLAAELGRRGIEYIRQQWNWDRSVAGLEKHFEEAARGGR